MVRGLVRRIFLDVAELRRLYVDEQLSSNRIAAHFGVSQPTVRSALAEAGIPMRGGGNRKGCKLPIRHAMPEAELRHLYENELWPAYKLAEHYGCSKPTILERLRAFNITVRQANDTKRGAPSPHRTDVDEALLVARYTGAPNMAIAEVAREFNVGNAVAARVLRENGVTIRQLSEVVVGKRNGSDNPNWRPVLTDEDRAKRRDSSKHAKWRDAVYERDGHSCQCCGDNRGGNLNAHHIVGYADHKHLRWDVANGITLCVPCHTLFHRTYGLKNFGAADLSEFIAGQNSRAP